MLSSPLLHLTHVQTTTAMLSLTTHWVQARVIARFMSDTSANTTEAVPAAESMWCIGPSPPSPWNSNCSWDGACVGVGIVDDAIGDRCANDFGDGMYGSSKGSIEGGVLNFSYDVRKTAAWGGYVALSGTHAAEWHGAKQDAPWNCSEATHLRFRYYVAQASTDDGRRAHLRLLFLDDDLPHQTSCTLPDCGSPGYEIYYSFHYDVLNVPPECSSHSPSDDSCWRERTFRLEGDASGEKPFVFTQWTGINNENSDSSDGVLDTERIVGYRWEVSHNSDGDCGDGIRGTILLRDLECIALSTEEQRNTTEECARSPESCRLECDMQEHLAFAVPSAAVGQTAASDTLIGDDVSWLRREFIYDANGCCRWCAALEDCIYWMTDGRDCYAAKRLDAEEPVVFVTPAVRARLSETVTATRALSGRGVGISGWVDSDLSGSSRRPSCESKCRCEDNLIDCSGANLSVLPRFAGNATILNLSRSSLPFLALHMLRELPLLQHVDARDASIKSCSPALAGALPSLATLDVNNIDDIVDLAANVDLDSNDEEENRRFGNVCCEPMALNLTTSSGANLFVCDKSALATTVVCPDCFTFPHEMLNSFKEGSSRSIRRIIASDNLNYQAADQADLCGEECTVTVGCGHFSLDQRNKINGNGVSSCTLMGGEPEWFTDSTTYESTCGSEDYTGGKRFSDAAGDAGSGDAGSGEPTSSPPSLPPPQPVSAAGSDALSGFVSGLPPISRFSSGARVQVRVGGANVTQGSKLDGHVSVTLHVSVGNVSACTANQTSVYCQLSLPQRGALWVDPVLSKAPVDVSSFPFDLTFEPKRLTFYSASLKPNASGQVRQMIARLPNEMISTEYSGYYEINLGIISCDAAFMYESNVTASFSIDVPHKLPKEVFTVGAVLVASIVLASFALCWQRRRRRQHSLFRLLKTRIPPELDLLEGQKWHLFLSHVWCSGQDQVAVIKRQLCQLLINPRIFLDVDDLTSPADLEKYVEASSLILIFLTKGYFRSANCLREVKAAIDQKKPVILVLESDERHGAQSLSDLLLQCPPEHLDELFDRRDCIPWLRESLLQRASLQMIAEAILLCGCPKFRMLKQAPLFNDLTTGVKWSLRTDIRVYASIMNEGAKSIADELAGLANGLGVTCLSADLQEGRGVFGRSPTRALNHRPRGKSRSDSIPKPRPAARSRGLSGADQHWMVRKRQSSIDEELSRSSLSGSGPGGLFSMISFPKLAKQAADTKWMERKCTHMLVYLNTETFVTGQHDGSETQFAGEVRQALSTGLPIVLAHDPSVPFEQFLAATPKDLVVAGLYHEISIPIYSNKLHREVGLALMMKSLGAEHKLMPNRLGFTKKLPTCGSMKRLPSPSLFLSPARLDGDATPGPNADVSDLEASMHLLGGAPFRLLHSSVANDGLAKASTPGKRASTSTRWLARNASSGQGRLSRLDENAGSPRSAPEARGAPEARSSGARSSGARSSGAGSSSVRSSGAISSGVRSSGALLNAEV